MTGSDLLEALGFLPEDMLAEAQALREAHGHARKLPKIWLIAATLAALLAGCVAGVLWVHHYSLGQEPYTKKFDENGLAIPAETHYWEIIPGHGQSGEAVYEAQREWLEFLKTYQDIPIPNVPDLPEIPNAYEYSYGCYTPEMVAKVDEILKKYDLLLLNEPIPVQRWQWEAFWEEAGMEGFAKSGTDIIGLDAMYYLPGNFKSSLDLHYDGHNYPLSLSYSRKDCFPQNGVWLMDQEGVQQWEHKGLLLALVPHENGCIFADRGTDMLTLHIRGDLSVANLEAIAELFNFTVTPKDMDVEELTLVLDLAEQAHQKALGKESKIAGGFEEVIKQEIGFHTGQLSYAFQDITGDKNPELLILEDGILVRRYQQEDGTVRENDDLRNVDVSVLEIRPLLKFPIESGTLADFIQTVDVRLSAEEVRQRYQDLLTRLDKHHYTHYGIADINGDGVEDLLLSGDGQRYWSAYTYRFGKIVTLFWGDFLLCEDDILEMHSEVYQESGRALDRYRYVRVHEDRQILLDQVTYDRSTASWLEEQDGSLLTEDEAQSRRYPLIDQGMNLIP